MITHSIGDQARSLTTRSSISRIKSNLNILLKEESSKQVADVGKKLQGNLRILNSIQTRIAEVEQYKQNANEVELLLERKQTALSVSQKISADLIVPFLDQSLGNSRTIIQSRVNTASSALSVVVEQMNAEVAGQALFSGVATDRPPLIPADQIVTELSKITKDMTTAEAVSKAVVDWFDAEKGEGGFLDFAYKGSLQENGKRLIDISKTRKTDLAGTAADPAIRNILKGLAMTAILEKGTLSGAADEEVKLIRMSANILSDNNDFAVAEMAKLGLQQEQLKNSSAENDAELAGLEIALNEIVTVDWEQTSAELSETAFQLQTMFAVTARLSRLTLTEFLR